jgi:hypothetical protein
MKGFVPSVGAFLAVMSSQYSLACALPQEDHIFLEDKGMKIAIQWPDNITVGHPFELHIIACHNEKPFTGNVAATAIMPAHNHGMNYRPSFEMTKPGKHIGSGFLFHMFGTWRLQLNFFSDERKYTFEHDIIL